MDRLYKIGFGGGCHWCTEGVFQSLIGVAQIEQGWIASEGDHQSFSEAVIVHFDPHLISLEALVGIHLHTHSCTSNHSMRGKYRSAVYTFEAVQNDAVFVAIQETQKDLEQEIITSVLPYAAFRLNEEEFLNYFYKKPNAAFCVNYIHPKLQLLLRKFSDRIDPVKLELLK